MFIQQIFIDQLVKRQALSWAPVLEEQTRNIYLRGVYILVRKIDNKHANR